MRISKIKYLKLVLKQVKYVFFFKYVFKYFTVYYLLLKSRKMSVCVALLLLTSIKSCEFYAFLLNSIFSYYFRLLDCPIPFNIYLIHRKIAIGKTKKSIDFLYRQYFYIYHR